MEPWFDANLYGWIPGTLLGVLGGTTGGLAGCLAPRGKAKRLVLGLWYFEILVWVGFLGAAVVALLTGQPYGVWYGLGLPGLLGVTLFGALLPLTLGHYRAAELRKVSARDL